MANDDLFLFVSHVREDRDAAMAIVEELEQRGVRCWIAPRNVRPGRPFDDEIVDAIETSRAMLLVFSDRCNESEYIRREVTVAGESQKIIIPFRIEDAQPRRGLRVRLSDLHWIDGFATRERAIDDLARHLGDPAASSHPHHFRSGQADRGAPQSPLPGTPQLVSVTAIDAPPPSRSTRRKGRWILSGALSAILAIVAGGLALHQWQPPLRSAGSTPTGTPQGGAVPLTAPSTAATAPATIPPSATAPPTAIAPPTASPAPKPDATVIGSINPPAGLVQCPADRAGDRVETIGGVYYCKPGPAASAPSPTPEGTPQTTSSAAPHEWSPSSKEDYSGPTKNTRAAPLAGPPPSSGTPAEAPPRPAQVATVVPPPAATANGQLSLVGLWRGWHMCQGTRVGTTVQILSDSSGKISGTREFYPSPNDPSRATGKFYVSGNFQSATGHISLNAGDWIMQPSGYTKCNFVGMVDATRKHIFGESPSCSCQQFELDRQ
jgi:hypothetical protein